MEKLQRIQSKLKAPKNQENKFGGYKYRSCEDILEAVKPLLEQEGLTMTIQDNIELIGDRYYIKATVKLFDKTNTVEVTAYAREEENKKGMDSMQLTGATSSYARKYALNGLFLIDDTKDSDATNTHGKEDAQQVSPMESVQTTSIPTKAQLLTDKQVTRLYSIASSKGYSKQDVLKSVAGRGFKEPKELPKAIYDEICNTLQELPDKK